MNCRSVGFFFQSVCHAELNAIMNKNSADVKGCSMYVALFPCNECAKLIIQAGKEYCQPDSSVLQCCFLISIMDVSDVKLLLLDVN